MTGGCRHDAVTGSVRHECVCLLDGFKPRIVKPYVSFHKVRLEACIG